MPSYYLAPIADARAQFFTAQGAVLNGGLLYSYAATSTTPQNTYTDSTGGTANNNPIQLNADGRTPFGVYLTGGLSYKFVLKDSAGNTLWTQDVIGGVNDTSSSQNEWVSGPTPTYVSATSFTLVGDQTSTFTRGRRLKFTVTAGTVYGTIINAAFAASTTLIMKMDGSGALDSGLSAVSYGISAANHPSIPASTVNAQPVVNGRLTLTSGTAVTTSDVTAATSVYFTPYKGNTVDLWDTTLSQWVRYTFAELTLAVPATTSTMYDVFLQNNAGTLQLNAVAWTNDTTRATALATQNGVYVKTGSLDQLYLGSFRTTTVNGQTEDSLTKRYVWNYFNRMRRQMKAIDTTDTWAYSVNTWRQARASTANQLDFIRGLDEDSVYATVLGLVANSTGTARTVSTGIGLDSTVAPTGIRGQGAAAAVAVNVVAFYEAFPGIGRHFLAWLEKAEGTDVQTWVGDNGSTDFQSGIQGALLG